MLVSVVGWFVCSEEISDSTEKALAREDRFPFACAPAGFMTAKLYKVLSNVVHRVGFESGNDITRCV